MKPLRLTAALVVALTVLGSSAASASSPTTPRTITLSSVGVVHTAPDAVRIRLTVTAVDASAKAASSSASASMSTVRSALKDGGVRTSDISTSGLSLGPDYAYIDGNSILNGYRSSQSLAVLVRSISGAGPVLDAVVAAGGDAVMIDSVALVSLHPDTAEAAARSQAVRQAKAKAASYARLLGAKLGAVRTVTENSMVSNYPIYMAKNGTADSSLPTAISAGEMDVTASVTVTWYLK